jgi:hypothetical protein
MISLDILVPFKNEAKNLPSLILSLESLNIPKGLDVKFIFSDNMSADNSVDIITRSSLKNLVLYKQLEDTGNWANINFLLGKIRSDYFMFIDAHDLLSKYYLTDFFLLIKSDQIHSSAYIGRVITLQEDRLGYKLSVQNQYSFSEKNHLKNFQLSLFLSHNSIYHSIFRTKCVKIPELVESKSWTIDHLISHAGFAISNIKYLPNSFYIRRYRKIESENFGHLVSGELVTRKQRGLGVSKINRDDSEIHIEICKLIFFKDNFLLKSFFKYLLKGKYTNGNFNNWGFRVIRYISRNIFKLDPEIKGVETVNELVKAEIFRYESLNYK